MQNRAKYLVPAMATLSLLLAGAWSARGQSYSERVLVDEPTFLWTLDDPDVLDIPMNLSSSVVDAEYLGDVLLGQDGLVPGEPDNKSASFNGIDAYVHIPDHDDINITNGPWSKRSWSLWFNADDVHSSEEQVLYEEGGATRGANIYVREGQLFLGAWNQANDDGGVSSPWISGEDDPDGGNIYLRTPIESGVTYHAALVMDGDEDGTDGFLRGYLNGGLFQEKTGVGQLFNHGANVGIGRKNDATFFDSSQRGGGDGNYFAGRVDEVALFSKALTQDQILDHLGVDVPAPGDFNRDGTADLADFAILTANFNTTAPFPESLEKGDVNRNGKINLADFREFRQIFNSQGGAAAAAVPEPHGLVLVGLAGLLVLGRPCRLNLVA